MKHNFKIIGCGSAGNHIAYGLKKYATKIVMTDTNTKNLLRSKNQIYIKRYKVWDKNIKLIIENNDKNKKYDAIIISTPPKTHLKLLKKNINKSNVFLIEKPLCEPNLRSVNEFEKLIKKYKDKLFLCGYNHRLFPSTQKLLGILKKNKLEKDISVIEINFKENISGFLKAHKWLNSLSDSYLSKTSMGGGSLLEHSHALNLGQLLVNDNIKQLKPFDSNINFLKTKNQYYDYDSKLDFVSGSKLIKIQQNFTTLPVEKNIKIFGKNFYIELIYNYKNSNDRIKFFNKKFKKVKNFYFNKTRADDFIYEAIFLKKILRDKSKKNILSAQSALDTMKLILLTIKKIN